MLLLRRQAASETLLCKYQHCQVFQMGLLQQRTQHAPVSDPESMSLGRDGISLLWSTSR